MKTHARELDVLSGIAIIFVVLIHANAQYLRNVLNLQNYYKGGYFLLAINKIIFVAVPIFIFIAGYKYHINKKESYGLYIKKRLLKVFVPFLWISMFFIIINNIQEYLIGPADLISSIGNIAFDTAKVFLGYNFAYPLWYVPMYLFVVLTYPLIVKKLKNQKTRFLIFSFLSAIYVFLFNFTGVFHGYENPFCFI